MSVLAQELYSLLSVSDGVLLKFDNFLGETASGKICHFNPDLSMTKNNELVRDLTYLWTADKLNDLADLKALTFDHARTNLFFDSPILEVPADLLFLGEDILKEPETCRYVQNEIRRAQKYFPNHTAEEVWDMMSDDLGASHYLGMRLLEEEESRPTDHSNLYTHRGLTVNVKELTASDFMTLSLEAEDRAAFESLAYVRSLYINTTPNVKLCYPEPFLASPSFIHGDLGFLHILQYQFWLWFMFIFLVVFYFVTFLCVVRWCANRNQPRRETRGASRSKCGDLITATVPVTWAISIIVSESTDATDHYDGHGTNELIVGVRAYQWGWEYYYPKGIDLNYNLKANYTSYGGKSLRYNTAAEKSLRTLGVWKSYQQKEADQLVTPAHLLVLPIDNAKLLNFMRFKTIGASVQRDSEAFKRVRSYSKVYSMNLVHTPSSFTEKYIKLNSFVSSTNDVNTAASYSLQRQHNLTASAAANGTAATFLDRPSLNKFLSYVRQYNINKQKTQIQALSPAMWLDADDNFSNTSSSNLLNNLLSKNLSSERLFWRSHLTNFNLFHSYPTVLKRLNILNAHNAPKGYGTAREVDIAAPTDYTYSLMNKVYTKKTLQGNPLGSLINPLTWVINTGVNVEHVSGHVKPIRGGFSALPYATYNIVNPSVSNVELDRVPEGLKMAPQYRSPRNYDRFDVAAGDPILSHGTNSLDANLTKFTQNHVQNSPTSYLQLRATRWDDLGRWNTLASNRLRAQAGYAPVAGNFAEYKPLDTDALAIEPVKNAGMICEDSTLITLDSSTPTVELAETLQPHIRLKTIDAFEKKIQKSLTTGASPLKKLKKLIFAQKELAFWLSPAQQAPVIAAQQALVDAEAAKEQLKREIAKTADDIAEAKLVIDSVEEGTRYEKAATKTIEEKEPLLKLLKEDLLVKENAVIKATEPVVRYEKIDAGYRGRLQVQEINHLYRGRLRSLKTKSTLVTNSSLRSTNSLGTLSTDTPTPRILQAPSISKASDTEHENFVAKRLPTPYFEESEQAPELPDHIRWDRSDTVYTHINPDILLGDLVRYIRGEALTSAFLETDCSDYNYKDPVIMARWESRPQKMLLAKNRQRVLVNLYRNQLKPISKTFMELEEFESNMIWKNYLFRGYKKKSFNKLVTPIERRNRARFRDMYLAATEAPDDYYFSSSLLEVDDLINKWFEDFFNTNLFDEWEMPATVGSEELRDKELRGKHTNYESFGTTDVASFSKEQRILHIGRSKKNAPKRTFETPFYPTTERALLKVLNADWASKRNQSRSVSRRARIAALRGPLEELDEEIKDINPDTHPKAYAAFLREWASNYRESIRQEFDTAADLWYASLADRISMSFLKKKSHLRRPETSLSALMADFKESIPGDFLSRHVSETDINYLTAKSVRNFQTYSNPLSLNPELYEEELSTQPYRRSRFASAHVAPLFSPSLSHYHSIFGLPLAAWWAQLQPQWQCKVHHYLNTLSRRDLHLATTGDYYSHTLEADHFVTPVSVSLSKDKSFIPLIGKKSRKTSALLRYNRIRELFATNSTLTTPLSIPFAYPQSYVSAFVKSDLLALRTKWSFEANSKQEATAEVSGGALDYQTWHKPLDEFSPNFTRQFNPIVVRTVAKNARAGYNALKKVVKLRFEEGRAHTHTYHAANVGAERPFATNTPVVATKLLGKNKESFYSSTFYANKPFEVFNDFASSTNSLNSYFFDFPFLVSQLSTPSRFIWFDWYTRWHRLDVQPASDASKATLIGSQRVTKLYQLPNEEADELGDHESYLIRNQRYRRNHLPVWLYNVSSYNKAAVWTQKDWIEVLPKKEVRREGDNALVLKERAAEVDRILKGPRYNTKQFRIVKPISGVYRRDLEEILRKYQTAASDRKAAECEKAAQEVLRKVKADPANKNLEDSAKKIVEVAEDAAAAALQSFKNFKWSIELARRATEDYHADVFVDYDLFDPEDFFKKLKKEVESFKKDVRKNRETIKATLLSPKHEAILAKRRAYESQFRKGLKKEVELLKDKEYAAFFTEFKNEIEPTKDSAKKLGKKQATLEGSKSVEQESLITTPVSPKHEAILKQREEYEKLFDEVERLLEYEWESAQKREQTRIDKKNSTPRKLKGPILTQLSKTHEDILKKHEEYESTKRVMKTVKVSKKDLEMATGLLKSWRYLKTAEYYWTRPLLQPASTSTQFTGSFSSSYKSTWRPYSSVQSYHYNITTLIDLLTRRELLYRQYLERTNHIIRLPRMLTVSPQNSLLAEVKASFKLIDPMTYGSEYSREYYYYSLRYFRFLMFKGWISSLGTSIKDLPINPKLVNEYLFFYFLAKRPSSSLGSNANLYKSQFRPLKKGITNMIRLHGTGAVAMPIEIRLQILASSRDVIHSWAIPSAGIKIDCIPGYTSHRILIFLTPGIYWGQCMEICGRYHHWMPIVVYFMKRDLFFLWCTHFGSRKDQKLLWDTDDRHFSDYLKFVSYDRASWLTELSKRM